MKFSRSIWLYIGVITLVVFFRDIRFFLEPRIWAEEGTLYYFFAYHHSWWEALFRSHLGYYSLFMNSITMFAANFLREEMIAGFFLICSLIVQSIPFALIWQSNSKLWDCVWKKWVGAALVLFTMLNAELWLTTTDSQFYFSLISFLILLEPHAALKKMKKWIYRSLLFVASFTGVLSVFLTPLYAVLWFLDQTRERMIQMGIMLSGAALQLSVFLNSYSSLGLYGERFMDISFLLLAPVSLLRTILLPLFGPEWSQWFLNVYMTPTLTSEWMLMLWMMLMATLVFLFSFSITRRERVLYVGGYLLLVILSTATALGTTGDFLREPILGQRYFYVPAVVMGMLIFREFQVSLERKDRFLSGFFGMLLVLMIGNGIWNFQSSLMIADEWKSWSDEVQVWREEPRHRLEVWPQGWYVDLTIP